MGFLDGLLGGVTSGLTGGVGSMLAGGLLSAIGGGKQSGSTTQTQQQQLDPRMQEYLYGDGTNGNKGLLSQVAGIANQPQSLAQSQFGNGINSYLYNYGSPNFVQSQQAAQALQGSNISAPQMYAANAVRPADMVSAQAAGTQINAPSQNNIDLTGAYKNFINGDAGANPYLTKALQSGVDMTNSAYDRNLTNLTNTLQRSVLPGIRSNAVLAGQYGGSRQGIAEGNALSDFTNQATNANLQLGQANSANTTGAQAQAYNQGQDRALAATQGLGAQQYGVASQNANLDQQKNLTNAQLQNQTGIQVSNNIQQANLANSQLQQQANQANLQAQLGTNQLNSANQATGIGLSSGLLGQAYNYGNANDNYGANKIQQAAGTLAPFTGLGSSQTNTSPYYTNTAGNLLGGATAGLGLYNAYKNASGGGGNFLNNNAGLNMAPNDLYSIFGS